MSYYNNDEYLKKQIVEQSRHLFVYGYNNGIRSEYLKGFEKDYPIKLDSNTPVALYFDNLCFPKTEANLEDKDSIMIQAICREYLNFAIASKILDMSNSSIDQETLNEKLSRIILLSNKNRNPSFLEIKNVHDLAETFKESRDFYSDSFNKYTRGEIDSVSIDQLAIPFLQLEMFVELFKNAINMDSYFAIIYDKKNPLSIPSVKSLNNYLGARINKNLSLKIATEPDDWESYRDVNGQFVQAVHDYGYIKLDDSYKDYMKRSNENEFEL